jgi:amidase
LPQLVLPAGKVDGAPVGVSLVGARGADRALLRAALKIARAE